jgi:hypothetical protein
VELPRKRSCVPNTIGNSAVCSVSKGLVGFAKWHTAVHRSEPVSGRNVGEVATEEIPIGR